MTELLPFTLTHSLQGFSRYILFSQRKIAHKPDIQLCGSTLKWVDYVKHLGNHLESNLSEVTEIRMKKSDMIQRVNTVVVFLGKSNDIIISKVFNSQLTHFYGAQEWRFGDKGAKEFQIMWNQCIRRLLTLPYNPPRQFLPHLIGAPSARDQIFSRFLKMQLKMETSENHRVSFITRMCQDSARSISGSNLRVAKRLSIDGLDVQTNGRCRLKDAYVDECKDSDYTALSLICELREFLNGY